jgi:divalent metal cation (Fe/Co/Zn/Cd) transporter
VLILSISSSFVAISWFTNAGEQIPLIVGRRVEQREMSRILSVALVHDSRIKSINYITVYHVGEQAQVELHIVLDADMPLHTSHVIGETLRDKLNALNFIECAFVHVLCER